MHPIIYSFAICALGAALEGLFAGSGIKQRLANLRLPSYAVPFWGWMVIGGLYYVICFSVLYRLFLLPSSPGRTAAFALIGAFMFINALWNYFFFRTRNSSMRICSACLTAPSRFLSFSCSCSDSTESPPGAFSRTSSTFFSTRISGAIAFGN